MVTRHGHSRFQHIPASITPVMMDPPQHDSSNFVSSQDLSDDSGDQGSLNPEAEGLVDRCALLLEEVETFQRSLRRNKLEKGVELRHFQGSVRSELRGLQMLTFVAPTSSEVLHSLRSSNLSYLETVWFAAKSATGIKGLTKSFTITEPGAITEESKKRGKPKKSSVSVDVVAQNGLQWIKVSTITNSRVLHEIAKAGWEESTCDHTSSSETELPSELAPTSTQLATSSVSLVKQSKLLHQAAEQTRIQYLHPTILFFLPNIHPSSSSPEIGTFLLTLLGTGARIQCGPDLDLLSPKPTLESMLQNLELSESYRYASFSQVLNIDCTILLALISDLSNQHVEIEPRFHPAILRQLEFEGDLALLPNLLFPALAGRKLVCTATARVRFEEIVDIVGSDTEKARASLILDQRHKKKPTNMGYGEGWYEEPEAPEPCEYLLERFRSNCIHHVPSNLLLPIITLSPDNLGSDVDFELECQRRIMSRLSHVNRSVFMTGWKWGYTTITSNRGVAKIIESHIHDGEKGPDLFVLGTARSLVGKAKKIEC